MAKTKTQKEAKLVKKNANRNVLNPVKVVVKATKTIVSGSKKKIVKSKKEEVKAVVKKVVTMRTRSGLHTLNPRKIEKKEAGIVVKVPIVGVDGVSKGNMSLPEAIFGQKPNKTLIAQAVRVYLANQRQGTASTKTRGFVTGSARKVYRQKGTGRARHGAITGPIFVGGGIIFGPHPHDFSLKFPKKMKKAALVCALSQKAQEGSIRVVDGDFSGKTKEVAKLLKTMELNKKGIADKILFVTDVTGNSGRAAHNLAGLTMESAATLTTYGVVVSKKIVFVKSSIDELTKRISKEN